MKDTVSSINVVLPDAEAEATDYKISDWLVELQDVVYDADDLLDDFSFQALRREVMTRNDMAKKVRIFFSKSNQVFFSLKMGSKTKEIRKRLDKISDDMHKFQLPLNNSPKIPIEYEECIETYSFVTEFKVIGREEEKEHIIRCLLNSNVKDVVSVLPIVGIGGLGKTALAQLVYNDEFISKHFELNMWVSVCDDFSVKHIAQKMLGHQTDSGQIEQVQQELRSKIKDKGLLLVLDDVWNVDSQSWLKLKSLLMEGSKGSMIIVTTRCAKVASIMGTLPPIELIGLNHKRSWKLFCQMAFKDGEQPNNSELVAIGKAIVRKSYGVPLNIRIIGSLFRNLAKSAWLKIRDMDLSEGDEWEKHILFIIKLSYDHLPSQLKCCFAYFSLFPKNFTFEKQTLIQLWMAQWFIKQSDSIRSQENVSHDYFMSLLSKLFFLDVEMDLYGEIWKCKMHHLIHDLALLVAGDEHIVVREGKELNTTDRPRHLSFSFELMIGGKSKLLC